MQGIFNLVCKFFLLMILAYNANFARANEHRLGLSLGGGSLAYGIGHLSYDQIGILPHKHWSIGLEAGGFFGGFLIAPRALYWEKASSMSGWYVGPKVVFGNSNYLNYSSSFFAIGGEGGWSYRFTEGPKGLDFGGGLDLYATNHGFWGAIKFTVGFLIPK
ncbi:hypothetical protein [Fluviispira sanaruensis]|uniref:Uncharacterized protein n=1 Tax=Fluviispira sanaruensis TaxID=2493639 RepID=A0A4P2VGG1_FLUSA|nr:hypothetical protein [Fluviispira sanaruensis]BBH51681.1 hypothetical protein JCM31447_00980 [Fluviispira sanaruensis]